MDFNSLRDQVSNLTLYDLKAGVRKVQNGTTCTLQEYNKPLVRNKADNDFLAVMNYTEMEAKVGTVLGFARAPG